MKSLKLLLVGSLFIAGMSCKQSSASNSTNATPTPKCPSKEEIKPVAEPVVPPNFDFVVESVSELKDIKGLCEVVVRVGTQPLVFYTDTQAQHIIMGNIMRVKDRRNLTRERLQEFVRLPSQVLKDLEKITAFTYGEGSKHIYYISDPDCPFCKRSHPILEEWAKKQGVQIKVILFPLPIHPSAFEKSVALICDKKGFKELDQGYTSKNQCQEGIRKVQDTIDYMQKLGIGGTPVFIGMNGRMHMGVPTEEDLNKLIQ